MVYVELLYESNITPEFVLLQYAERFPDSMIVIFPLLWDKINRIIKTLQFKMVWLSHELIFMLLCFSFSVHLLGI